MNPGEAIGWTEFDVLARDAAVGAHVAMCLREELPSAFVRSEPDPASSVDEVRPHLLHCSASIAERGSEETRRLLEEALSRIEPLGGGQPPARVVFTSEAAAGPRRRAA
jgi:hypothetical protein